MAETCAIFSTMRHIQVRIINFDYSRMYQKTQSEINKRLKIIKTALGNLPLVQISALQMRLPMQEKVLKDTNVFMGVFLHFVSVSCEFLDVFEILTLYNVQSQPFCLLVCRSGLVPNQRV
jgi:hypothetical protein